MTAHFVLLKNSHVTSTVFAEEFSIDFMQNEGTIEREKICWGALEEYYY